MKECNPSKNTVTVVYKSAYPKARSSMILFLAVKAQLNQGYLVVLDLATYYGS